MNKPSIITTPNGDRMAVLPLADDERLVAAAEETRDIQAFDTAKRRLVEGEDELLPSAYANRLMTERTPFACGVSIEAGAPGSSRSWPASARLTSARSRTDSAMGLSKP